MRLLVILHFVTILFTNSFIKIPFQKKQYNLCECSKYIFKFIRNNTLHSKKCIHLDIPCDDADKHWDDGEIPWEFNDTQIIKNNSNNNPMLEGHNVAFLFI